MDDPPKLQRPQDAKPKPEELHDHGKAEVAEKIYEEAYEDHLARPEYE